MKFKTWRNPPESPERVVDRVARLRELLLSSAAAAVVVCEAKPLAFLDVRPFNQLLNRYLDSCGVGGYGCKTQIKMSFLAADGVHVNPQFDSVIDRTYACALIGTHVPNPASDDDFIPPYLRRRWEIQWPRLGGNPRAGLFGT